MDPAQPDHEARSFASAGQGASQEEDAATKNRSGDGSAGNREQQAGGLPGTAQDEACSSGSTGAAEDNGDTLAMVEFGDLPAPADDSPKTLIGSTAATRNTVHPGPLSDTSEDTSAWVSLDELDELTIVARAQDGDPQAFDWLISAYQSGVYRLCYRMLNDRSDAEDVVQETFIAAWRSLPKLTVPQAFIPWLYRTATNKCLDELRRRKRRPADPAASIGDEASDDHGFRSGSSSLPGQGFETGSDRQSAIGATRPPDPAQNFENQAQMRALADLLQTIPPGPRACWLLREVHEFSYAEIATIVRLPESTVRGRIARAKRLLAEGMEPWR